MAPPTPGQRDVLDSSSSSSRRRRGWAVALVAVLAFGVWVNRPTVEPAAPPPAAPVPTDSRIAVDRDDRVADVARQLTYADDRHGFLLQEGCSVRAGCTRRVVATSDGGASWQPRGALPAEARFLANLYAVSPTQLAVLGSYLPAAMTRSIDGGRTWTMHALRRGPAAAAPPGAPLVVDAAVPCPVTVCAPWLAWVDVATARLHRLPGQPPAEGMVQLQVGPTGPDGELVAAAVGPNAASVWVSVDAGRSWQWARLPVAREPDQAIWGVHAFPAGGGRVYAYVKIGSDGALPVVRGYRLDDGVGLTLLGTQSQTGVPSGVLAGELIGSGLDGAVRRTSQGGRTWAGIGLLLGDGELTQQVAGGPVLATVVDISGLYSYYQSRDGRSWRGVTPPEF